jgi:hypothetical protein
VRCVLRRDDGIQSKQRVLPRTGQYQAPIFHAGCKCKGIHSRIVRQSDMKLSETSPAPEATYCAVSSPQSCSCPSCRTYTPMAPCSVPRAA